MNYNMDNDYNLYPFIKWAGGKRQLLSVLTENLPDSYNNYYEPFLGGGALFWRVKPKKAFLSDFNDELINAWKELKLENKKLIEILHEHERFDSKEHYLKVRSYDRCESFSLMSDVERAARFIYLNKAGFNGMWRVNKKGQNNIPYGSHKSLNLVPDFFEKDSVFLNENSISIKSGDYKDIFKTVLPNDFVYFDPPYIPLNKSSFTSYTNEGFDMNDQMELAEFAKDLSKMGVKIMLSNSDAEEIKYLYPDDQFKVIRVPVRRVINSKGSGRGYIQEVLIKNY